MNRHSRRTQTSIPPLRAISVLVSAALIAFGAGCTKPDQTAATPPKTPVEVMTVEAIAELRDDIKLPGVTQPNRVVRVAAEVAGRIEEIAVEEGQLVTCGPTRCVIAKLNTDLLQAQYDRFRSEAEYNQRDFERIQSARDKGVATQMEVDQARMKAESYKALAESAAAELERSTIQAPIDGQINRLPVEMGEYLQPGTLVAEIVDLNTIKVEVDIPELDIGYFEMGDKVEVVANHYGGKMHFDGTITYISQLADPGTFTSRVEVSVPNDDRLLRTGQIVDVLLTRQVIPDAITVPLLALIPRDEDHIAYVVTADKAEQRVLELGMIRGQEIRITRGVEAGDQLIIRGHHYVSDGQEVAVVAIDGREPTTQPAQDVPIDTEVETESADSAPDQPQDGAPS